VDTRALASGRISPRSLARLRIAIKFPTVVISRYGRDSMSNTSLRSALDSLAQSFASGVLNAIRSASIEELLGEGARSAPRRSGPGRPRGSIAKTAPKASSASAPASKTKGGRLARRTPEEIAKTLGSIVSLVKGKKNGLRSEEIRAALKLDKREMPRVLGDGLSKKLLKSRGQKRATTYFAA
jgi:hypothetical protein